MKKILVFLAGLICVAQLLGCEGPAQPNFVVPVPKPEEQPAQPEQPEEETPDTPETPTPAPIGGRVIVGYVTYWETRMPDPTLLTHINYAFALIKDDFESRDVKKPDRLKKGSSLKPTAKTDE